jgi:GTP cyclohydrolase I
MAKYLSDAIRDRMKTDGHRFFANDNVSKYVSEEQRAGLVAELTEKFQGVLGSLLIDTENDPNSNETAKRLAKMYVYELMAGRFEPRPDVTSFPNDSSDRFEGMLIVRAELTSMCSHHHQPVKGIAIIGIIPTGRVIGLSKYARIAQWCARRGTLQEELANHIANEIMSATDTENVAVYVEGEHGCMVNRGVMAHSSLTQTTVVHGLFHNNSVKSEFLSHVDRQLKTR